MAMVVVHWSESLNATWTNAVQVAISCAPSFEHWVCLELFLLEPRIAVLHVSEQP